MRYEPLNRDVVGTHEKSLVEEEEEFLEGFKEGPLGQEAEALVGQHPPLAHILELVESKELLLIIRQKLFVVLLIKAEGAAVKPAHHPVALLCEDKRRLDCRCSCCAAWPHFYAGTKGKAEGGNLARKNHDLSNLLIEQK